MINNRHAYLIMGHNNFYNVEILLKLLDDERNSIFLHIDKKVKDFDKKYFEQVVKKADIHIYQEIKVNWGGFSQVQCELFLLGEARKTGNYLFYHLLSSADLPIKSQDEIHLFFEQNKEKQFIQFDRNRFEQNKRNILWRVKLYHPIQEMRKCSRNKWILKLITLAAKGCMAIQLLFRVDRLKNKEIEIAFGSQWFSINQKLVDYILENKKDINKLFYMSQTPDELFLQTVVMNSRFKEQLYIDPDIMLPSNVREIGWNYEVDNEHPQIYTIEDWERLKMSSAMFARKFSDAHDRKIINRIYRKYGESRDEKDSKRYCNI